MPIQADVDALRHRDLASGTLFINGREQGAESGATLEVLSPIDGQRLTDIPDASPVDVDHAVTAARHAFESGSWSRASPAARARVLYRIADLIETEALSLAVLGVRDNGTELGMALRAEPGSAAGTFRYYAGAIDKIAGEVAPTGHDTLGLVLREPVGVVGAIVPWNFPLMIGAWKLAPALAAGNSVVLKPSEVASLSLLRLAAICHEAGLPEGVLNVVTGAGETTGRALGLHPDVDTLVFTGSGHVGRRLLEYSARSNLKRIWLELGGKAPNVVFDDARDLDEVAQVSAMGIFRNSGQVCVAGSRLLVHRSIVDELAERIVSITRDLVVGDPLLLTTDIGAISCEAQLHKNLAFARGAEAEGADCLTGGQRLHEESGGWYMAPGIYANVRPETTLAREEAFGPLLAIMPFDDEDDAVRLANDTSYGLASAVWTADLSRAHRMVRRIRAGVVHVNTYGGADTTVPLGGVRQSGNGHDKSLHALNKYVDLKTAWIKL